MTGALASLCLLAGLLLAGLLARGELRRNREFDRQRYWTCDTCGRSVRRAIDSYWVMEYHFEELLPLPNPERCRECCELLLEEEYRERPELHVFFLRELRAQLRGHGRDGIGSAEEARG